MPTKSVAIRLPEELVDWLKAKAEREHRTLSNVIVDILLTVKENG
jgi:predicted DNA-binding protein